MTTNASSEKITFVWLSTAPLCSSSIHYLIIASNCGVCPQSVINTTATCHNLQPSTEIRECRFSVQSVVCGVMGNTSEPRLEMIGGIQLHIHKNFCKWVFRYGIILWSLCLSANYFSTGCDTSLHQQQSDVTFTWRLQWKCMYFFIEVYLSQHARDVHYDEAIIQIKERSIPKRLSHLIGCVQCTYSWGNISRCVGLYNQLHRV